MKSFTLNIVKNGQVEKIIQLNPHVVSRIDIQEGTIYQILDEQGKLVISPNGKLVGDDLWIFLESLEDYPSIILENYKNYASTSISDLTSLQKMNATFAISGDILTETGASVNHALLATEVDSFSTVTATGIHTTSSATGFSLGMTALGAVALGGVAIGSSGGGSKAQVNNTTPSPLTPSPLTPSPLTPAPLTPAPLTPAPLTPAPSTPSPSTPAPSTPAPSTPSPSTPAPSTPAPSTPSPSIPAPTSPSISINKVTGDDVVNINESNSPSVPVTGKVYGGFRGQVVSVTCSCPSCSGGDGKTIVRKETTLDKDGNFSVGFKGNDVAKGTVITAKVEPDADHNTTKAEGSHEYTSDLEAPTVNIALNKITGDNILSNLEQEKEITTIAGKLSQLSSDIDTTKTVVKIFLGGKEYIAKVSGNTFSADVETTELTTNKKVTAIATVTDNSGNTKESKIVEQICTVDNSDSNDYAPTDIHLSSNIVTENKSGAIIGKLSADDKDANDYHKYKLKNYNNLFEIVDNVLKVKDGVSLDFEEKSPANDGKYPQARHSSTYYLKVLAEDKAGHTITKTVEVNLHNEYEGAKTGIRDGHLDLPYFIAAEYEKNVYQHATTPNGWGKPTLKGGGLYGPQREDWTDFDNIIGHGRKVVWGFGNPYHKDNAKHSDPREYTAAQKDSVRKAMAHYAEIFNIKQEEREVTDQNHSQFDFVFYRGKLYYGTLGYTGTSYFDQPLGNNKSSNNIFLSTHKDTGYGNSNSMSSGDAYLTLLHEIGHAFGLNHVGPGGSPPSNPFLRKEEDNQDNSVMSYNPGKNFDNSLAMYDRATLEYMYGLNDNYRSGNHDEYVYKSDLHYIADGSGSHDTFDLSAITENAYVNLTPGSWCYVGKKGDSILEKGQVFIGYDTHLEIVKTGSGNDYIVTGTDDYYEVYSGGGNDIIIGRASDSSLLNGGQGDDIITGGLGNDKLLGGLGNDILMGKAGDDILTGGEGSDTLTGGKGSDKFVFDSALNGDIDKITDFAPSEDLIQLSKHIFTELTAGHIKDNIIYDEETGELSYDNDGPGGNAAVHFATLSAHLNLTEQNFSLVA